MARCHPVSRWRGTVWTINGGGGGTTGLQYYPLPHPIRLLDAAQ